MKNLTDHQNTLIEGLKSSFIGSNFSISLQADMDEADREIAEYKQGKARAKQVEADMFEAAKCFA